MGVFGFGKDTSRDTRPALEQARHPEEQGGLGGSATALVEKLLDVGIDGRGRFTSATKVAGQALAARNGDVEKAIDDVVSSHLRLAGASGFLTNLGGFGTMLVSLPANVVGFYVLATRTSAAIASLRGYDLTQPEIRSAVLLSLVGADAQQLLARAGAMAPTGRLASMAAQRLPAPALMVVNKAVGFRLVTQAGKGAFTRFGRAVPVVGGAVGAGMDLWLMKQLADHARVEFPPSDQPDPDLLPPA